MKQSHISKEAINTFLSGRSLPLLPTAPLSINPSDIELDDAYESGESVSETEIVSIMEEIQIGTNKGHVVVCDDGPWQDHMSFRLMSRAEPVIAHVDLEKDSILAFVIDSDSRDAIKDEMGLTDGEISLVLIGEKNGTDLSHSSSN